MRSLRRLLGALIALVVLVAVARPARAADDLDRLERAFKKPIEQTLRATVTLAWANARARSSGVLVARSGLILSDSNVGAGVVKREDGTFAQTKTDYVTVRVANVGRPGFTSYDAKVLHRFDDVDSTLLEIVDPPAGGFPDYLKPAGSDHLRVGDFTFVAGDAFAMSDEAPPTLTAGVVSALIPAEQEGVGKFDWIITSAAVVPGVNGGPIVDVGGRLIGTVSTWGGTKEPFQFLGKVIPMDRLRAAYADTPEFGSIFEVGILGTITGIDAAEKMSTVFDGTAAECHDGVVSVTVNRKQPVMFRMPAAQRMMDVPRYAGPISGIVVSPEGHVLTSLYNLTNSGVLQIPGWDTAAPRPARLRVGLEQIQKLTVHAADGTAAPYELSSYHESYGLALLAPSGSDAEKAAIKGAVRVIEPVAADDFAAGRYVLALGNPFGATRTERPLLTVGILSKRHDDDAEEAWRGNWQTDAALTDGNCGGAAVDIEGRLYGMLAIWNPLRHGRAAGIGFVVPWARIESVLPELLRGRTFARPFLGVSWKPTVGPDGKPRYTGAATIQETVAGAPAAEAGLLAEDVIEAVDGTDTPTIDAVGRMLKGKLSGDVITLRIRRGEEKVELKLTLGARE